MSFFRERKAKKEEKAALEAEIASLRAQYKIKHVYRSETRNVHSLRVELGSLRAAVEEEREAIKREQEALKTAIRSLRSAHNLSHILPSDFHETPASLRAELSSLLDAIEKEKQEQYESESLKAEICALRNEYDLVHIPPSFRKDITSLRAEYESLHKTVRANLASRRKEHEKAQHDEKEAEENEKLLARIMDLRSKYKLSHIRQHLHPNPRSLWAELNLLLAAVAEIERDKNRPLSDQLLDYNNWNPLTVIAAGVVATIAAPVVGPILTGVTVAGVAGAAVITTGNIVHSNNARAIAELEYRPRRTLQIEGRRSSSPIIEYPDSDH